MEENLIWRDHIHNVEIKQQKILNSYIKESIISMINGSSKSTLLTYMLI